MSLPLEQFVWHRPENGFEWIDGRLIKWGGPDEPDPVEQRLLVERPMDVPRYQRYNPLSAHPTLFKTFADMTTTEDAYAEFAARYGALGVGGWLNRTGPMATAEPWARWREEHVRLRAVADVLTALQANDSQRLRSLFLVEKTFVRYERQDPEGLTLEFVARPDEYRDWLWTWATEAKSSDEMVARFASGWAQEQINQALGGKRGEHESLTSARVLFNLEEQRMILHVTPTSLLAAMWLQCARVLTVNPTFKECEHCGKWFETSPDARRRQAKYCSDRCKVAAYRTRKVKQGG